MSRSSLSPAAFRSTSAPDGYSRGRSYDDTAGDAIFTPAPQAEVEDKYSRLDDAIVAVENHDLVKKYGFPADALITNVDSDHPVEMGFEVLAVLLVACQAADELADLTSPKEVCKILGWIGNTPPAIKHFGADRLFRFAGALQARVSEIRAERARPKSGLKRDATPRQTLSLSKGTPNQVGGIKPRLSLPAPHRNQEIPMSSTAHAHAAPRQALSLSKGAAASAVAPTPALRIVPTPAPRPEPFASARALRARIADGMVAAIGLKSQGAAALLDKALAAQTELQAERLVEQAERMLRVCEATPLPAPPAPRAAPRTSFGSDSFSRPMRRTGKTARERAEKAAARGATQPAPAPTASGKKSKGKK